MAFTRPGFASVLLLWFTFNTNAPSFAADVNDQMGETESDEETAPPEPPAPVAPKAVKKKAPDGKKTTGRKVADAEPEERPYTELRASGDYERRHEEIEFLGGVSAGFSGLTGTQAGTGVSAVPNYTHNTLGLGAEADARGWKYFGAEAEGFLGLSAANSDFSSSSFISRSLDGFYFDLKGQYPIQAGQIKLVPKLGVGYGFAQLNESSNVVTRLVTASSATRMTGFYGIAGAEVVPYQNWLISVDYLHNFSSDGSGSNGNITAPVENVVSGNFDRLRAGVFYRVVPHFIVGGEYVRRTYNYGFTNAIVTTSVLGVLPVTDARIINLNEARALFLFEL